MIIIRTAFFLCVTLLSFCAHAFTFQASLYGDLGLSELDGYVQIPQGGSNGSTSLGRPTLDELRLRHTNFYTAGTILGLGNYDLMFKLNRYAPRGSALLSSTLLTHGKTMPAGSMLQSYLKYDLYALGFGRRFNYHDVTLLPYLQFNFLKFHYEYDAYPIKGARNFNVTGFNLGVALNYAFTDSVSCYINLLPPFSVANFTQGLFEVGLSSKMMMTKHVFLAPKIAAGLQQFDYEDNQAVPNHIHLNNMPYAKVGIEVGIRP